MEALSDVSLGWGPGRMVGLVGRNGAGKTTLLRTAIGLLQPRAGSVRVLGLDLEQHPGVVTTAIGYLGADERSFPPRLTPLESLALYGGLRGIDRRRAQARARALAEEIGAGGLLERPFQTLSSGQRQRIGLVRATLHGPRVLLLDEPTHALDRRASQAVLALARREAARGALVVISSHDLDGIEAACDQLVVLEQGRVLVHGPRAEVLPLLSAPGWRLSFESASACEQARARFRDLRPGSDPLTALIDEDERERFSPDLERLVTERGIGIVAFQRRERLSLEEFVATLGGEGNPVPRPSVGGGTSRSREAARVSSAAGRPDPPLRRSASVVRAVLAIVRRDLATQLSYRFKLFIQLVLLLVWVGMFYYISRLFRRDDARLEMALYANPFGFLVIGLGALEVSQVCMTHMAKGLREEQLMGTLEPLLATGRSPLLIALGSVIWPLLTSLFLMGTILAIAALGLGADLSATNWPAAAATTVVACLVVIPLGVVSAAFVHRFKRGDPVAIVLNLASLVTAGAYFPRELLPEVVQRLTAVLPHTTALAAARAAMLGGAGLADPAFHEPFLSLCVSGLILAPLAIGIWRLAHRQARARGSLTEA